MIIKDKFYSITGIPEIPNGVYGINPVTGKVKNIEKNKLLKGYKGNNGHISIHICNGKKFSIHGIMAAVFLRASSDPTKTIVHHINGNPEDNRLENLEMLTPKEHGQVHKGAKYSRPNIYYKKLDDQGNEVERIYLNDLMKDEKRKRRIQNAASLGHKTEGFHWRRGDENVDRYIEKYGIPKDSDWRPCRNCSGWSATKNGLFKSPRGIWTLGKVRIGGGKGYYYIATKVGTVKKNISAHREIWETFNDEQRLLKKNEVIDHIDGNKKNNNFSNLKVTDPRGNNNNPITLAKYKKAARNRARNVEQYTLAGDLKKVYSCAMDAAIKCGVSNSNILRCCSGRTASSAGFLWCFEGESDKIKKDQKTLLFKYDQLWNLVGVYFGPGIAAEDTTISNSTIIKYTKSGKLAPDNHYYHKGPKKITSNIDEKD